MVLQGVSDMVLQGVRRCYRVLHGVTRCYRMLHGVTWCYTVLESVTGCYIVLQKNSPFCPVLGCARFLPKGPK